MKAFSGIAGYGGIALAVYALLGISEAPTLGNTAMLCAGVGISLFFFFKLA